MKMKKAVPIGPARVGLIACSVLLLAITAASGAFARGVAADQSGRYGTVYHPGPGVTNPRLVYAPDPEYPKNKKAWARANVICEIGIIVDKDGMPRGLHVVQSGGKDFDAKAMKAVRQYRFAPALYEGKPVAAAIRIEVNFRKY
jgi:TonB family protein